jgi:hypothetical protein
MTDIKLNVTNMNAGRMSLVEKHMDDNGRDTSEKYMNYHKNAIKAFINKIEAYDNKKFEDYVKEYCENNDNFDDVVVEDKPEKVRPKLTKEHLEKMQAARREKAAARKAAAEAEKDVEVDEKPKPKAKAKAKKN